MMMIMVMIINGGDIGDKGLVKKYRGGWAGGNDNLVPQKSTTHPLVVAQNFGDPPLIFRLKKT